MAQLALNLGIPRFKLNEDLFDKFMNGTSIQTWQSFDGTNNPTLRKFLADKSVQFDNKAVELINLATAGLVTQVQTNAAAAATSAAAALVSKTAAALSETNARASELASRSASEASGAVVFYDTKALADAATAGLPANQIVEIFNDETRGGARSRYRKESGTLVFKTIAGMDLEDSFLPTYTGATPQIIRKIFDDIRTTEWFGATAIEEGGGECLAAFYDHAAWCDNYGRDFHMPKRGTYGIGQHFQIPTDVGFVGSSAVIRALNGFADDRVIQLGVASPLSRYQANSGIKDLKIDLNDQAGVKGLYAAYIYATPIWNPLIFKARNHGIHLAAGYQINIFGGDVFGSSPHSRFGGASAPPTPPSIGARGFLMEATDSNISNFTVQQMPTGFELRGGANVWTGCRAWSAYTDDETSPMYWGWLLRSSYNKLFGCVADSPRLIDNSPAAAGTVGSEILGGVGFVGMDIINNYLPELYGCHVIISPDGNEGVNRPLNGSIKAATWAKPVRGSLTTSDNGGGKFASPRISFKDDDVERGSTWNDLVQGQTIANNYVANRDFSFTPALTIGGVSTGITYASRSGWMKKDGGEANLRLNIKLSSKGSAAGALRIDLPITHQSGSQNEYFFGALVNGVAETTIRGVVLSGDTKLTLQKLSGAPLSDTDVSNTSEIYFTFSLMTNYGAE